MSAALLIAVCWATRTASGPLVLKVDEQMNEWTLIFSQQYYIKSSALAPSECMFSNNQRGQEHFALGVNKWLKGSYALTSQKSRCRPEKSDLSASGCDYCLSIQE